MRKLFFIIGSVFLLSSCVSSKVYKELQSKYVDLDEQNIALRKDNDELSGNLKSAENQVLKLKNTVDLLKKDTTELGKKYRALNKNYRELNKSYEFALENNNNMLATNQQENQKLLMKLQKLQMEVQTKEDSLISEQNRLEYLGKELQKRESRVYELEQLIAKKDSAVENLRQRMADALLNFEGKGLSIERRNGKVYISLENSLLFPSGSWDVNAKGASAIKEVAKVLAENKDLNVVVEGHTDSDAFNGRTAVKDNWDLSVMRATSIVKIITDNKGVDPAKITAAGKSEFVPLVPNDDSESKAKNRRTEIIITPDVSELMKLLNEEADSINN